MAALIVHSSERFATSTLSALLFGRIMISKRARAGLAAARARDHFAGCAPALDKGGIRESHTTGYQEETDPGKPVNLLFVRRG